MYAAMLEIRYSIGSHVFALVWKPFSIPRNGGGSTKETLVLIIVKTRVLKGISILPKRTLEFIPIGSDRVG